MSSRKYPSEIFGHPHTITGGQAAKDRNKYWCPFVGEQCDKKSRLTKGRPFGVCSAHFDGKEIALCPKRFRENSVVFSHIAKHHFGTTNNILVFPEVGLSTIGNFDFVMVKHKPMSTEIEDFTVIEFQAGQTTNTGKLVNGFKDFLAGKNREKNSYGFGINMYDIWKRTFTQILSKGVICENWKRKIYWVVQEPVYADFSDRYNLHDLSYNEKHATVFVLCDITPSSREKYQLKITRKISVTMDRLFDALRNRKIPSVDKFLKVLQKKVADPKQLVLHLSTSK